MPSAKKYTVITGASQGLGKAFAECCAKRGQNLLLVSLPSEGIFELEQLLKQKFGVDIYSFELDLTNSKALNQFIESVQKFSINSLINNAGMGGTKAFHEATKDDIDKIILLNMRSLVLLTHQLLPKLKQEKSASILNISSLAAFVPMPYKTVYPASKAFVYSFSRGLQKELKKTNVHVAVAHPGGMATNPEVSKRIQLYKGLIKRSILPAEKTAEICLEGLDRKERVIIPGRINQISSFFQRVLPDSIQMNLIYSKIQKELSQ